MLIVLIVTEENKEGGDDANMMQMNGDIQGNGATNQEDAEMEEGKKMKYLLQFALDNASLLSIYIQLDFHCTLLLGFFSLLSSCNIFGMFYYYSLFSKGNV